MWQRFIFLILIGIVAVPYAFPHWIWVYVMVAMPFVIIVCLTGASRLSWNWNILGFVAFGAFFGIPLGLLLRLGEGSPYAWLYLFLAFGALFLASLWKDEPLVPSDPATRKAAGREMAFVGVLVGAVFGVVPGLLALQGFLRDSPNAFPFTAISLIGWSVLAASLLGVRKFPKVKVETQRIGSL